MVNYRLTKKGKIVLAVMCVLVVFGVSFGASALRTGIPQQDYSNINLPQDPPKKIPNQEPPSVDPPKEQENIEEPWKDLKVSVFFEPDLSSLQNEYKQGLEKISDTALSHRDLKIQIEGNCAAVASGRKNQKQINYAFSVLRAQTVANYLKLQGIEPDRLIIVGNGSDKPVKDNSSPEGRKYNRRVDVFFKME